MPGIAVFAGTFLLFAAGLLLALTGHAGPDPAKWLLHRSGLVALCLLLATIAVASLRRVAGIPSLLRWRRPLGLASFAAATLHVLVYVTVFQGLDVPAILDDVVKRPYILIGLACWLLLLPLALTSTRAARQRLGRRWHTLHRVVYVVAVFAIAHQGMAQKADLGLTFLFATMLVVLLVEKFRKPHHARGTR